MKTLFQKVLRWRRHRAGRGIWLGILAGMVANCEVRAADLLTPQETSWLAAHPVIRIAPTPDYRPIEYFDATGHYSGITADYFKLIQQRLGCRFQVVRLTPAQWQQLDPVARGADVVTASAETPTRRQYWSYTAPYLTLPTYVITRESAPYGLTPARLTGARVAVVSGWAAEEYLRTSYSNLVLVPVPDAPTGLQQVSFGGVNAFVSELPVATTGMEERGISNLKISAEAGYTYHLGISVRKDWPELRAILDKALATITPEERQQIYDRWMQFQTPAERRRERWGQYFGWSAGALAALVIAFLVWNRQLTARVRAATRELQGELARRTQVETELRASEEKFARVFRSSPLAISIADPADGRFVDVNDAFVRMHGCTSRDEVVGHTSVELGIWSGPEEREAVFRQLHERRRLLNFKHTFRLRSGPEVTGLYSFELIEIGGREFIIALVNDITERTEAESALQESETRHRFLFEHNPMPMFIYERGTLRMLAVNEAFTRHYGYSEAEVLAMHLTDLYPDDQKQKIADLAASLHGHRYVGEWRHRRRDGSYITIVVSSHDLAYRGRDARVAVMTDITERKQVEEALRQSEEQFRLIMENLADLVAVVDLQGRRLYNSPSYRQILGEPDRLYGTSSFEQIHPDDRELVQQAFQETIRTGVGQRLEYRLLGHDGQERYIESQGSVIRDSHGAVIQVVVVSRDVTDRRRAEAAIRELNISLERRVAKRTAELAVAKERAESADRLKSAFLATMSHELRTPLNSIIGFTGIMLQGLAGSLNAEQTKQLGMVQGSARHLLALINDVLDISKIEAGQLEIHAAPFDLAASLHKVVGLIQPLADRKHLQLRLDLPLVLDPVVSDRVRVEQVLLNLLNNAVKFTEHGEVTLTAEVVARYKSRRLHLEQPAVCLAVADTGPGIKPEDLPKLFQPFRQVDTGLARSHEGTGLGLAICRRLSIMLGGEISVKSTWGRGSVFTFVLPVTPIPHHETDRTAD